MREWLVILAAAAVLTSSSACTPHAYVNGDAAAATVEEAQVSDTATTGEAAAHEDPQKAKAREEYFLGLTMINHNNYDKAIEHLETAAALAPESYNTHVMLARSYAEAGREQDAVKALENAIGVEPSNPQAYDLLMELYLYQDNPQKSLDTANAAIKAGVDENRLLDLGWTYYQLGQNDEAEARFKNYIEVYGESYGPLRNLGLVEFTRGNYKKALEYLDRAEKLDESNMTLPYIKALTYEKLGMTDEAMKATLLFKSRDKNYMRSTSKYDKNYFPHADPGSVNKYLYMLKDDFDTDTGGEDAK